MKKIVKDLTRKDVSKLYWHTSILKKKYTALDELACVLYNSGKNLDVLFNFFPDKVLNYCICLDEKGAHFE